MSARFFSESDPCRHFASSDCLLFFLNMANCSTISSSSLLDDLPYELLPSIFSLLPPRDLLLLKSTCHLFSRVIQSDTLWRDAYINRFVRAKPDSDTYASEYVYGHSRRDDLIRRLDWQEQDTPLTDTEVFGLARSCVGNGSGGQGWQKEAIHREAMLECVNLPSAADVTVSILI